MVELTVVVVPFTVKFPPTVTSPVVVSVSVDKPVTVGDVASTLEPVPVFAVI